MAFKIISKRSDPLVRRLRKIRDGGIPTIVFCEGLRLIEELLDSSFQTYEIYCVEKYSENVRALTRLHKAKVPIFYLSEDVMSFVSDLSSAPGILAIGEKPNYSKTQAPLSSEGALFLLAHQIQLPQNLGALIRTAEATGVTEVWTTSKTVDPLGAKVLRGSMGSALRVPIRSSLSFHDSLKKFSSHGIHIVGATQRGEIDYDTLNWKKSTVLVVGSEGSGFSIEELKYIKDQIRIPMAGQVESLNVGIAAAVCLFEAYKQRRSSSS